MDAGLGLGLGAGLGAGAGVVATSINEAISLLGGVQRYELKKSSSLARRAPTRRRVVTTGTKPLVSHALASNIMCGAFMARVSIWGEDTAILGLGFDPSKLKYVYRPARVHVS